MKKVLVVDDERRVRELLKTALEDVYGLFAVTTAVDGREALEILGTERFSLVLTDLQMPGVDGIGVMHCVQDFYPGTPVMIITGFGTPDQVQYAQEQGAAAVIAKPFVIRELVEKIEQVLDESRI